MGAACTLDGTAISKRSEAGSTLRGPVASCCDCAASEAGACALAVVLASARRASVVMRRVIMEAAERVPYEDGGCSPGEQYHPVARRIFPSRRQQSWVPAADGTRYRRLMELYEGEDTERAVPLLPLTSGKHSANPLL